MTDLTPQKIQELTALMASAPPQTAARLLAMFERMKVKGSSIIPSTVLIAAMRESGLAQVANARKTLVRLPTFERLFFEPIESLFENGSMEHIKPGSAPRAGLKEVWRLIAEHFVAEDVAELEPRATAAILRGDMDEARELAGKIRAATLTRLACLSQDEIADASDQPEARAFLRRLAPLLIAAERGHKIWSLALDRKGVINEAGVAGLCDIVLILDTDNRDAARELLLLTMSVLPLPSEALKVFNKALNGVNGSQIEILEYDVVWRRALALTTVAKDIIERALIVVPFDGAVLAKVIAEPVQSLHGLECQAQGALESPWRGNILATCAKIWTKLEAICEQATNSLQVALPSDHIQTYSSLWAHKPRFTVALEPSAIDTAVEYLAFIAAARPFGVIGEFSCARNTADKYARTYLSDISEALLRASRVVNTHDNMKMWVESVTQLLAAAESYKASQAFARNAADAARAA